MIRELNLLYVEDDETAATMLQRSFKRYCTDKTCHIEVAETVAEAISKIDQTAFDAVLLDWNLTDGSGPDVASHIRATDQVTPIIFLSGTWVSEQVLEAHGYDVAGCLEKNYTKGQVEEIYTLVSQRSA